MTEEIKEEFYCYLCEYRTKKCSDRLKHQNTKKHLRNGKPKQCVVVCEFSTSTH